MEAYVDGPPDAVRFQALHESRFVVARRRFGEVLFGLDGLEPQHLAFGHGRQAVLHLLVVFVRLVLAFLVDLEEAVELRHAAGGAEHILHAVLAPCRNVDGGLVEERRHHLGGHETIPDQPVELHLVFGRIRLHHFRRVAMEVGRMASCASCASFLVL